MFQTDILFTFSRLIGIPTSKNIDKNSHCVADKEMGVKSMAKEYSNEHQLTCSSENWYFVNEMCTKIR